MQTNTSITVDNKQYSIDSTGKCYLIQQPTFVKHDENKSLNKVDSSSKIWDEV